MASRNIPITIFDSNIFEVIKETKITKWINFCNVYLKKYKEEGYIEYVGIAYDEQERIKDKKYPLIEWQMTEKDCLQYCYDRGFDWNGLYEHFDRVSCWCCPLKNQKELTILWQYYPDLWEQLKEMDKKTYNYFKPPTWKVEGLEQKFISKELKKKKK